LSPELLAITVSENVVLSNKLGLLLWFREVRILEPKSEPREYLARVRQISSFLKPHFEGTLHHARILQEQSESPKNFQNRKTASKRARGATVAAWFLSSISTATCLPALGPPEAVPGCMPKGRRVTASSGEEGCASATISPER
jgi:hypothetical protein